MWHWLLYHTGGTWNGPVPSPWYNEPSGFVSCLGLLASAIALTFHAVASYRHKNCHVRRCPRIGHLAVKGTPWVVCRRHSPTGAPTHAEVIDAHAAAGPGSQEGPTVSLRSRLEDIAGSLSHIATVTGQNKVLLEQNAVLATRANELIEANTVLTGEVKAALAALAPKTPMTPVAKAKRGPAS